MDKARRAKMEAAGWKVGDTQVVLELRDADMALIEIKIAAAEGVTEQRKALNLTQAQVADVLGPSQSRVAKMKAADPSVSFDLLI